MLTQTKVCEHGVEADMCETCTLRIKVEFLERQLHAAEAVFEKRLATVRKLNSQMGESVEQLAREVNAYHPVKVVDGQVIRCQACGVVAGEYYHRSTPRELF